MNLAPAELRKAGASLDLAIALGFGVLLAGTSGIVISILYITASKQRLVYSALSLILIAMMGPVFEDLFTKPDFVPAKLQPSLLVWALMTIFVEFLPRETADADKTTAT